MDIEELQDEYIMLHRGVFYHYPVGLTIQEFNDRNILEQEIQALNRVFDKDLEM